MTRLFLAVSVPHDFYALLPAPGIVSAIERIGDAPDGSLLLRDSDDGSRGVVVAERVATGWLLREGAAS